MSHDFFVMNGVLDYYYQNAVSCIYALGKKKDQEIEISLWNTNNANTSTRKSKH